MDGVYDPDRDQDQLDTDRHSATDRHQNKHLGYCSAMNGMAELARHSYRELHSKTVVLIHLGVAVNLMDEHAVKAGGGDSALVSAVKNSRSKILTERR